MEVSKVFLQESYAKETMNNILHCQSFIIVDLTEMFEECFSSLAYISIRPPLGSQLTILHLSYTLMQAHTPRSTSPPPFHQLDKPRKRYDSSARTA